MSAIDDLIKKAKDLIKQENYPEALSILRKLYCDNPNLTEIKDELIDALSEYGAYNNDLWIRNYDEAIKCFQEIISLDPNNYRAYYNLGISYHNQGDNKKALEACQKAVEIKPDYAHCYYNMGLIYEENDDFEKALLYYKKALKADPKLTYAAQAKRAIEESIQDLEDFEKEGSTSENDIKKLKDLFKISKKIEIQFIQDILKINKQELIDLLIGLGKEFGAIINGEYLEINQDKLEEIFNYLESKFIKEN
ncbi:MAG: tetratricopeptide repeat protein [Promethearchaeota archaeon]